MIREMSIERDSDATRLQRQLVIDLGAATDPQAAVGVLLRYADDRSAQLRRGATKLTAQFLTNSADGMQRLATEVDEAARAAWGDLAPHVPQPPQGPVIDDRDLLAHEAADEAWEANRRSVERISAQAMNRMRERRRG